MKPKAKTLIEKHGFVDQDRKTSEHDKIQIWVFNNIVEVLKQVSCSGKILEITSRQLEYPIEQISPNYRSIVGFVDLHVRGYANIGSEQNDFFASIEIKSRIESCGDLIRQINFYKRYELHRSTWIVVSPDDRFASILKEQWIHFVKYKDPGELF